MLKERWNDRAGGFHPVSAPDFLPRPQLRELQSRRLQAVVARAWDKVALFRERLQARALTPNDIGGIGDIAALPFTVKADLRDTYPFGLFASPMDGGGAAARLLGHDRQAHRGRLHPRGRRGVDRGR
jgi:phenylacetate-CoA ligase